MEGEQPYLGDLLTMVINHLLNGMILQAGCNRGKWRFRLGSPILKTEKSWWWRASILGRGTTQILPHKKGQHFSWNLQISRWVQAHDPSGKSPIPWRSRSRLQPLSSGHVNFNHPKKGSQIRRICADLVILLLINDQICHHFLRMSKHWFY